MNELYWLWGWIRYRTIQAYDRLSGKDYRQWLLGQEQAVLKAALSSGGRYYALSFCRPFMLAAIQRYPELIECASLELRDDPELVRAAYQKDTDLLQHASEWLRDDLEFMCQAVKHCLKAAQYASERVKQLPGFQSLVRGLTPKQGKLVAGRVSDLVPAGGLPVAKDMAIQTDPLPAKTEPTRYGRHGEAAQRKFKQAEAELRKARETLETQRAELARREKVIEEREAALAAREQDLVEQDAALQSVRDGLVGDRCSADEHKVFELLTKRDWNTGSSSDVGSEAGKLKALTLYLIGAVLRRNQQHLDDRAEMLAFHNIIDGLRRKLTATLERAKKTEQELKSLRDSVKMKPVHAEPACDPKQWCAAKLRLGSIVATRGKFARRKGSSGLEVVPADHVYSPDGPS